MNHLLEKIKQKNEINIITNNESKKKKKKKKKKKNNDLVCRLP